MCKPSTSNVPESQLIYDESTQSIHAKPALTIGVSIERHSKGPNWSVRVDGAESIEDAIAVADKMRNEMEHRFGTQGA